MIYYLSLGTNVGDLEENLKLAINKISALLDCFVPRNDKGQDSNIKKKSSVYQTKAWGLEEQDDFLNLVLEVESGYKPIDLLVHLKNIEKEMGRVKTEKWGPRVIDIDILFCDDLKFKSDTLEIPHPFLHEREFVLKPFIEIAPNFIHPVFRKTMNAIYKLQLWKSETSAILEESCRK